MKIKIVLICIVFSSVALFNNGMCWFWNKEKSEDRDKKDFKDFKETIERAQREQDEYVAQSKLKLDWKFLLDHLLDHHREYKVEVEELLRRIEEDQEFFGEDYISPENKKSLAKYTNKAELLMSLTKINRETQERLRQYSQLILLFKLLT